jgi:hypothetical protein
LERISRRPTDEEIRKGQKPENVIILRAGETPPMIGEEMEKALKKLPSGGEMIIVGSGIGKIDPECLKFVENYKLL